MHWFWRVTMVFVIVGGFEMWYLGRAGRKLWELAYESGFGGDMRRMEQGLPAMAATAMAMLPVLLVAFTAYGLVSLVWGHRTMASGEMRRSQKSLGSRMAHEVHCIILAVLGLVAVAGLFVGLVSFAKPVNCRWNDGDSHFSHFRLERGVVEYYSQSWSGWPERGFRIPRVIWYQAWATNVRVSIALWSVVVLCAAYPIFAVIRGPLRRYRRRVRGLCRHCGYNLTGNMSGVCPECGERI